MTNLYDPLLYSRPVFQDCKIDLPILDRDNWTVELKQDGIFGLGICIKGHMDIYALGGDTPKGSMDLNCDFTGVVIGEYMYGSNWAFRHNQVGWFHLFDILVVEDIDLRSRVRLDRRGILERVFELIPPHPQLRLSEMYPADCRNWLWDTFVVGKDYEGLVYKFNNETYLEAIWFRTKMHFSLEYICMGFKEGDGRNKGRMGSMIVGVYKDGKLTEICGPGGGFSDQQRIDMWEHPEQYIGRVCTITGHKIFSSGALRHPNFKEWRDDKKPENCTFENLMRNRV